MIQAETLRRLETSLAGPAKAEIRYELTMVGLNVQSELARVLDLKVVVKGPSTAEPDRQGFVYGLWREDCVELFIANPENGRYVEYNFAPSGAWWSRVFEDIRQPGDMGPPSCNAQGRMDADRWSIEAQIDLETIRNAIGGEPDQWVGNLIVLVGGCDDDQPDRRNLHSLANLTSVQPDFHRPQDFLPFNSLIS